MPTYITYKPFGMLSQFTKEAEQHVTLKDLDFTFSKDVYPVGRLDADSEGLLILTDNRALNAKLLHPQYKQPKIYWAQVEGEPKVVDLLPLQKGIAININGKMHVTAPAKVGLLHTEVSLPERDPPIRFRKNSPTTWIEISITEGKNRQVRKMLAAIGFPVLRLVRVGIAGLFLNQDTLKDLAVGEVRQIELTF
jgi:23S rRNA pseudouridine2457 synthase